LSFEVLGYATTPDGRSRVERHPTRPDVHVVVGCPTVDTAFGNPTRIQVRQLCAKYSPVPPSQMPPLGFNSGGALIAFAHGVPNNAPLILHKRSAIWVPLFPARVTSTSRDDFAVDSSNPETIRALLLGMRQARLADAGWVTAAKPHARNLLLVLAALGRPPRTREALSRKTALTILEVDSALKTALRYGWVDGQNRLTDAGHAELMQARKPLHSEPKLVEVVSFYYPKALRAPQGSI
jgi:hypothetical protein